MPDSPQDTLSTTDEYVIFSDEDENALLFPATETAPQAADTAALGDQDKWKVMVVDDEPEIHDVTALSLEDFSFEARGLTFISAYSGEEAKQLMELHPDTALILLDVVMETDDAGLLAVKHIRQVIGNHLVRIVLRTGQPGHAPEETVIVDYDINDYKAKTELTTKKLFTTVVTALRAFRHVTTIESQRQENAALYAKLQDYSRTLAENERKYRTLFEDSRDAIYITTPAGQFVDINQAMLDLFGYTRSKMLQLNAREVYANPADRAGFRQTIEQVGSVRDFELKFRKMDGSLMDCLLTATVRRDDDGRVAAYQGIIRDITERKRQEEAERRLEIYRNSPQGRAETLAQSLLPQPQTALIDLYQLAQTAGQEPDAASLLGHLPKMLETLEAEQLAELAAGFDYLLSSQAAPELLPVGLRQLIAQLEQPFAKCWSGAGPALKVYQLCQAALDINSIAQIRGLLPHLSSANQAGTTSAPDDFLSDLRQALAQLLPVAKTLHACERVDTAQDKLAYLARAVERLGQVGRLAQTELGGADRPVIYAVSLSWLAVVTGVMSELQSRARITCRLVTRQAWQDEIISLALGLRNEGRAAAINLKVWPAPAPEYSLLDEMARIERLAPGEEARVELRIRLHPADGLDHFRAQFVIHYDDPRGPDQVENFADEVHLLADEGEFHHIPNPYVVGTPLKTGSPLFFGRKDLMTFIQETLDAEHRHNLVLIGQRRVGKTSLLKQLLSSLGDAYLPVYLDGQALGLDPGLPNFLLNVATEIVYAMEDQDFNIEMPELKLFADRPAATFEHQFLGQVRNIIGDRHLLVLVDEFEELELAVQRGTLEPSIFGFLRHLVQHVDNLSLICCGTHRLEELVADYWSALFNISLYQHVAYLQQPEALRLIQEPVAAYGMRYDDLALDKMLRVTGGHPYFLQLLCHSLVNRHNKMQRSYVTVADVNEALDEILTTGEAHFVYLWTESTAQEQLVLAALSRMMPFTGQVKPAQVVDYLAERGVTVERQAVSEAMHHLTLRDILQTSGDLALDLEESYRWQLGLLGLWAEKYKSLSRVVDETKSK